MLRITMLERMIFWELMKVFLLSLLGLTGILLMAGLVAEASQQGLSPSQIIMIIPLLIPSTLPYTIPATTLFATCVVYGRLTADNELLAMRASGINIFLVIKPALLLGILSAGLTMGLYYHVIPYTHHLLRSMFINDIERMLYAILERQQSLSSPQSNYSMFVRGVQGRKLINPTFKRTNGKGQTEFVAQAREAELKVDMNRKLLLVRMRHGVVTGPDGTSGYFQDKDWEVPLPDMVNLESNRRPRDMTWEEMKARRVELAAERSKIQTEIDLTTAQVLMAQSPSADTPVHLNHLKNQDKSLRDQQYSLETEIHMRPALALGCVCFVLIGCPVGIWFGRSDFLSSFITCFLPIVFVYYPLILCGTNLAKAGHNPILTVWGPDILLGVIGVGMFWKLSRN